MFYYCEIFMIKVEKNVLNRMIFQKTEWPNLPQFYDFLLYP